MQNTLSKVVLTLFSLIALWGGLLGINAMLDTSSVTYHELTEEIDLRDIDTGNALNYLGDETSSNAVYGAIQTLEHPPGKSQ